MKALISASFILLFIASCGSSSKKTYTVTDDNNGTKSPRLKEVVTKTADNNKSEEKITRYTYNDDNLLISKKTSYVQKRKEDEGTQDLFEITYTYTQDKQVKTRKFSDLSDFRGRSSNQSEYTYGEILYEKTKLPVVDTITVDELNMKCVYQHTYFLDASNLAITLDKIHQSCTSTYMMPFSNPEYHSNYSKNDDKIYSANLSKHTEQYAGSIATYNQGLLEKVEDYTSSDTNTNILEKTSYYHYENKPYFYKVSSSPMIDLPH